MSRFLRNIAAVAAALFLFAPIAGIPSYAVNLPETGIKYVIPCGTPFGIKLKSEGVMVIETAKNSPAEKAGIKPGDVITAVNGTAVDSNESTALAIQKESRCTDIVLKRDSVEIHLSAKPENVGGVMKLGMWIRDSAAGIGTLTFYSPDDNTFGGLGHGVSDVTTGETVPLRCGEATSAEIFGVIKGEKGCAGELCGTILSGSGIGEIYENCNDGVFGKTYKPIDGNAIPVAKRSEVHPGSAKILVTTDSSGAQEYDIEILRMNFFDPEGSKGMLIRITDDELLGKTGGIVRGMSGSPVIQDGKLAGAITHVLVNDPTCGYAIPAETMLKHSLSCVSH